LYLLIVLLIAYNGIYI